jgi:hypothetical protein
MRRHGWQLPLHPLQVFISNNFLFILYFCCYDSEIAKFTLHFMFILSYVFTVFFSRFFGQIIHNVKSMYSLLNYKISPKFQYISQIYSAPYQLRFQFQKTLV